MEQHDNSYGFDAKTRQANLAEQERFNQMQPPTLFEKLCAERDRMREALVYIRDEVMAIDSRKRNGLERGILAIAKGALRPPDSAGPTPSVKLQSASE